MVLAVGLLACAPVAARRRAAEPWPGCRRGTGDAHRLSRKARAPGARSCSRCGTYLSRSACPGSLRDTRRCRSRPESRRSPRSGRAQSHRGTAPLQSQIKTSELQSLNPHIPCPSLHHPHIPAKDTHCGWCRSRCGTRTGSSRRTPCSSRHLDTACSHCTVWWSLLQTHSKSLCQLHRSTSQPETDPRALQGLMRREAPWPPPVLLSEGHEDGKGNLGWRRELQHAQLGLQSPSHVQDLGKACHEAQQEWQLLTTRSISPGLS